MAGKGIHKSFHLVLLAVNGSSGSACEVRTTVIFTSWTEACGDAWGSRTKKLSRVLAAHKTCHIEDVLVRVPLHVPHYRLHTLDRYRAKLIHQSFPKNCVNPTL